MTTVALLTDFGVQDHYAGVMKAVIFRINPYVQFIDISHSIEPQDIFRGALMLKAAYPYFPSQTIFLAVVDPGVGSSRKPIVVETPKFIFVAPDNGILSAVYQQEPEIKIYAIENQNCFLRPLSNTFHGRDIFAPVAGYLSRGLKPSAVGPKLKSGVKLYFPVAKIDDNKKIITGQVLDIDRFGNLITNIEGKDVSSPGLSAVIKGQKIKDFCRSYNDVAEGDLLALIGSQGFMEISINQNSAALRLKAKKGDKVEVFFK